MRCLEGFCRVKGLDRILRLPGAEKIAGQDFGAGLKNIARVPHLSAKSAYGWATRSYCEGTGVGWLQRMPSSLKRYQSGGSDHFITFTCYHRRPMLAGEDACRCFLGELERLRQRHGFYVFGYVVMPDHVHLLLSEPRKYVLATTLNVLKHETSERLRGSDAQFWQRRYYDFNVLTQRKFVEKLRYMHRNPVEEGLCEKPEDWPWSSFRHWLSGEQGIVEVESHWTWDLREREGVQHPHLHSSD